LIGARFVKAKSQPRHFGLTPYWQLLQHRITSLLSLLREKQTKERLARGVRRLKNVQHEPEGSGYLFLAHSREAPEPVVKFPVSWLPLLSMADTDFLWPIAQMGAHLDGGVDAQLSDRSPLTSNPAA
jgi:hypothetical protein